MRLNPIRRTDVLVLAATLLAGAAGPSRSAVTPLEIGGFASQHEIMVAGTRGDVWAKLTGDVRPWWDHSFRPAPHRLLFEDHYGGSFYEAFDDSGNGARHAVVIYADRPNRLIFEGPLGLSGNAILMVVSYDLEARGDSTRLRVTARCAGESKKEWAQAVDGVWAHFIVERFQQYYVRERARATR
jgi:hypothetical protein